MLLIVSLTLADAYILIGLILFIILYVNSRINNAIRPNEAVYMIVFWLPFLIVALFDRRKKC